MEHYKYTLVDIRVFSIKILLNTSVIRPIRITNDADYDFKTKLMRSEITIRERGKERRKTF